MIAYARRNAVQKPAQVEVKARRFSLELDADLPRHWVDGEPFLTHFMNALSIVFPPGERMFMDSVKAVRSQVQSPMLREDVAGFLGQEAMHSRAHQRFNDYLRRQGYPVDALERLIEDRIVENQATLDARTNLSMTCALEHLTAIMGHLLLSKPAQQALIDPRLRPLWLWHALEETEHKAVAFDVYQEVFGDYRARVISLVAASLGLLTEVTRIQAALLAHDGLARRRWLWARGLWKLWGPGGMFAGLLPLWLAYFRRDFHPWQHDNSQLVQAYRAQFDAPAEAAE